VPTLLLAGLHLAGSGLTNVGSGLASELGRMFKLTRLGFAPGEAVGAAAPAPGWRVQVVGTYPRYFVAPGWVTETLGSDPPDAVLVSGPGFMAQPFLRQLQPLRGRTRLALYLPVEGELSGDTLGGVFDLVDHCFLYTRDALQGAEALCRRMEDRDPAFRPPALAAVGHGFDYGSFRPLDMPGEGEGQRRRAARRQVFPDRSDLDSAFIVLNANRIAYRKRLDLTLDAFARFARGKADARLCLHIARRSADQERELRAQIEAAGLSNLVLISPEGLNDVLSVETLNLIYNACDVGLSTSSGEGWGLGTFEHAATRAAQVVPDHTSFRENWAGAAELVETAGSEFIFYESTLMHAVRPEAAAAALERLYSNSEERGRLAKAAYRRATAPVRHWRSVARRMEHEFSRQGPRGTRSTHCGTGLKERYDA
jgi:glycosyltransferase involved in cell wall biosynthesis